MLISCKITHSVLAYLERNGEDVSPLLQSTSLPEEFLNDPSYWMQAHEMENFLSLVTRIPYKKAEPQLLQKIGHSVPELRSWGVLDSVLRMMPSPQELLAQPSRFLSYFISPEPPVDNIIRTETSLQLDLPIPSDQFPYITTFLKAAFETLPVFMGKQLASCHWEGMRLELSWDGGQNRIFDPSVELGHQISPELLRSIVSQLEKHQLELQQKNAELEARNQQLRKAYEDLEAELRRTQTFDQVIKNPIKTYDFVEESSLNVLKNQIARLGDYMVRAQQLITILMGQNKSNAAMKEVMKKMDWENVKQQFPMTLATCVEVINHTEQKNKTKQGSANV